MPLVYLPFERAFFFHDVSGSLPELLLPDREVDLGRTSARVRLALERSARQVEGTLLPLVPTVALLSRVEASRLAEMEPSLGSYALASKLALELVARERIVPSIRREGDSHEARWAVALAAPADAARARAIANAMPPSAHAVPVSARAAREVWAPHALLVRFFDDVADALVREAAAARPQEPAERWERRFAQALAAADSSFEPHGFVERTVVDDLDAWSRPAIGATEPLATAFRLELPTEGSDRFTLRFFVHPADDPSLLVDAAEVFAGPLDRLGAPFRNAERSFLLALGRASRVAPSLADCLREAAPSMLALDPVTAWRFLRDEAPALASAGFRVIVPSELTPHGRRRLRARMRLGARAKVAGVVEGASRLSLDDVLEFEWEAAIGDEAISKPELAALAAQKAPLVRHRGQWIAIDPDELAAIEARTDEGTGELGTREAIAAALTGEIELRGVRVSVSAAGAFREALDRLRDASARSGEPPAALRAILRPYQSRGLAWLGTLASLGFGACLADDMGLGKTVQYLAFLLDRLEHHPDRRPNLLIAPTSVVGNWEREVARFSPDLKVVRHYGTGRARDASDFPEGSDQLVVTSYGILRRDAALLSSIEWATAALDEAQNVKNAASLTARAARSLRAPLRFALTGTPVENRLAELWSILEFTNPGMLGTIERFRREVAVPIERYRSDAATDRLKRLVGPFVLRRLKSDPTIIDDLPPKNEMKVFCSLTREQATLYRAAVDEEMNRIATADGMERRGRVLALLAFLKQICNHPAQYLGETAPLDHRSGKLARVTEMLEEALAAGDRALVFTQFREMGILLAAHFTRSLETEVAFLHGGTPQKARDAMVQRFQEDRDGPRIFVLSLKAGGTGLNLTAANHVFHFDRWWNPAVEDQATDRAYRIGQTRSVQVHKLLCAGTVEEKIDRMLEEKRELAAKVVGAGERWITELDARALHELVALSTDAVIGDDDEDRNPEPARTGSEIRA
jgi:superfamily II DNA or RNA helicase